MRKVILQVEVELNDDKIAELELSDNDIKGELQQYPTVSTPNNIVFDSGKFEFIKFVEDK